MRKVFTYISMLMLCALIALCMVKAYRQPIQPYTAETQADSTQNTTEPTAPTTAATTQAAKQPLDPNKDLLLLVNYNHPIPRSYKPQLVETEYRQIIDKRAAKPLEEMLAACRAAGYQPVPCSGYRSPEEQEKIFDEKLKEYLYLGYSEKDAEKETEKWIQLPGTSEHHTGLAMDIIDLHYQILDEKQNETATQQWLMKHCHEYGFIVRYPDDKKDITHIQFESWHYRYVGKENANKIHASGLCLEEYLADMPA